MSATDKPALPVDALDPPGILTCQELTRAHVAPLPAEVPQKEVEEAMGKVGDLFDVLEECQQFDHHGYCQTHFTENPCSVAVARDAFRVIKSALEKQVTPTTKEREEMPTLTELIRDKLMEHFDDTLESCGPSVCRKCDAIRALILAPPIRVEGGHIEALLVGLSMCREPKKSGVVKDWLIRKGVEVVDGGKK